MKNLNVYNMKLHDCIVADDGGLFTTILRVPGGWIYRSYDKGHGLFSAVFVPYDDEFT